MPVTVTGDTAEAVAYALMQDVLLAEGVTLSSVKDMRRATRADLLALYGECLAVVRRGGAADGWTGYSGRTAEPGGAV